MKRSIPDLFAMYFNLAAAYFSEYMRATQNFVLNKVCPRFGVYAMILFSMVAPAFVGLVLFISGGVTVGVLIPLAAYQVCGACAMLGYVKRRGKPVGLSEEQMAEARRIAALTRKY